MPIGPLLRGARGSPPRPCVAAPVASLSSITLTAVSVAEVELSQAIRARHGVTLQGVITRAGPGKTCKLSLQEMPEGAQ
ncbi:protein of unknown function [Rhodovastum atsumiense]|nr:protein of unknown function [Rhodovastum atsumiense]